MIEPPAPTKYTLRKPLATTAATAAAIASRSSTAAVSLSMVSASMGLRGRVCGMGSLSTRLFDNVLSGDSENVLKVVSTCQGAWRKLVTPRRRTEPAAPLGSERDRPGTRVRPRGRRAIVRRLDESRGVATLRD